MQQQTCVHDVDVLASRAFQDTGGGDDFLPHRKRVQPQTFVRNVDVPVSHMLQDCTRFVSRWQHVLWWGRHEEEASGMFLMRLHSAHFGSRASFLSVSAHLMFLIDGVSFLIVALRPSHLLVRISGFLRWQAIPTAVPVAGFGVRTLRRVRDAKHRGKPSA